jgi:diaminopimelate epimerase
MVLHEPRSPGTDAFMAIYNSDGSQSGACGNGTRCAAFLLARETGQKKLVLETAASRLACVREAETVFTVDMGAPRFAWNEIPLRDPVADTSSIALLSGSIEGQALPPPSALSMGNPHAIFFVDDIEAYDLAKIGPLLEHRPIFPERANISLAKIVSREQIKLKVWERGVGLTRACGSAACAALVAAARRGLSGRQAAVSLPGGDLGIVWRESDGHVLMTGPVEFEFETRLDPKLFEGIAA